MAKKSGKSKVKAKKPKAKAKTVKAKPAKKKLAKAKPVAKKKTAKVKVKAKPKAKPAAKKIAKAKKVVEKVAKPKEKKIKIPKEKGPSKKELKQRELEAQILEAQKKERENLQAIINKKPAATFTIPYSDRENERRNLIAKKIKTDPNKVQYSDKELAEFKKIIDSKLADAKKELHNLQQQIANANEHGTDDTAGTFKMLEDGSESLAKEEAGQLAMRQMKFIEQLENALVRIENKTYGICRVTGKLIPKERLRSVPHATLSIEAKLMQNS